MEEKNITTGTMKDSRIRNTEEVHFTDRLYDGNIILKSSAPFCNAGQWRYTVGLIIMVIVLLGSWLSTDITVAMTATFFVGLFGQCIIKNRIAYRDVKRYNKKLSFYLPYQMQIEELGDIVKKVLEAECEEIDISFNRVNVQYRDLWIALSLESEMQSGRKLTVSWELASEDIGVFQFRYALWYALSGGWKAKYAAQAVASISYIVYKVQQEIFQTDEESRQYYTGNPAMYQRVKTSIPNVLFKTIMVISFVFAVLTQGE